MLVVLDNHALFAVFDVLPICFEVDIEKVIASKHELCRRGAVGGVDSCAHAERNCRQDTDPAVGQVVLAAKVLGAYHVMNCLMRPFHHSVRLGILRCDRPSYDAVVAEEVDYFSHKFAAAVHYDFGRPWVPSEPYLFKQVGDVVCPFVWHFNDLEPSGSGINHCHGVQGGKRIRDNFTLLILLDFTNRIGTDEVDTYRLPWNHFGILGVEFPSLGCRRLLCWHESSRAGSSSAAASAVERASAHFVRTIVLKVLKAVPRMHWV
jgi:hypothetical protein